MSPHVNVSIREILAARGREVAAEGLIDTTPGLAELHRQGALDQYREFLDSRSFRKVLGRLAAKSAAPVDISAIRQSAGRQTDRYIQFLSDTGLVIRQGEAVSGVPALNGYGHHLEWCVAAVCAAELSAVASWNVKIRNLLSGGDFDVLLNMAGVLVHIELKSIRPSAITETEVRHFLQRRVELSPDLAILMVDTDDDVGPMVALVNRLIVAVYRTMPTIPPDYEPDEPLIGPQTLVPGIYWGLRNLYLVGSHPSFLTQLRRCLRFYNEVARHQMYLGGDPPNFLTNGLDTAT